MPGIISPTANFTTSSLGRLLQLTTNRNGLVGEFLFGRDAATSGANSAGAKAAGAELLVSTAGPPVINPVSPIYGDHQVEVGNGAGLNLGVPASLTMTVLTATTVASTNRALTTGSGDGVVFNGASFADPSRVALGLSGIASTVSVYFPGPGKFVPLPGAPTGNLTLPRAFGMRVGGTGVAADPIALDEFMGGIRTQGNSDTVGSARAAPTYLVTVGTSGTTGAGGGYQSRVLETATLIWNRYLADAELLAAYADLRAFLAPWKAI